MPKRKRVTEYDPETGEVQSETDRPVRGVPHWPGEWWRMEATAAALIRENRKKLTMLDMTVFMTLVEHMEAQNIVRDFTQVRMAEIVDTSATAICRSMKTLMELGWVQKLAPSTYRVDVLLGWNGTGADRWELAKAEEKKPRKRKPSHLKTV